MLLALAVGAAPLVLLAPPRLSYIVREKGGAPLPDAIGNDKMRGTVVTHGPWDDGYDMDELNEWQANVWSEASAPLVYIAQEWLDENYGTNEEGYWAWVRLLKQATAYLPDEIKEKLEAANGDWDVADIPQGWRVNLWQPPQIEKYVADERARRRKAAKRSRAPRPSRS